MITADSRRRRSVTIDAVDAAGAIQCSPAACVIANADRRTRWQIPPAARAMIRAYDTAGTPMPPGITIRLEPPARLLGTRAGTRPGSGTRSGAGTSVATRRPSTRHVNVDPPAAP